MTNRKNKGKRKSVIGPDLQNGENLINNITVNRSPDKSCGGKIPNNDNSNSAVIEPAPRDERRSEVNLTDDMTVNSPGKKSCGGDNLMNDEIGDRFEKLRAQLNEKVDGMVEEKFRKYKQQWDEEMEAKIETEVRRRMQGDTEEKNREQIEVDDEWSKYEKHVDERFQDINEKVAELSKTVAGMVESLNFMSSDTSSIKTKANEINKQLKAQGKFVGDLKNRVDDAEDRSRRWNIRIYDIPERDNENCEEIVKDLLQKLNPAGRLPFDRAHRLGKPLEDKTRPIIVKMTYYTHKQIVLEKARSRENKEFGVGEDFSKETYDIRRKLMAHLATAKQRNRTITAGSHINYRTLVVKCEVRGTYSYYKRTLKDISENPNTWFDFSCTLNTGNNSNTDNNRRVSNWNNNSNNNSNRRVSNSNWNINSSQY